MPKPLLDPAVPLASHRGNPEEGSKALVAASNLFIAVAIVAVLYFGRAIFIPIVIAGLLSFVLAPLVLFLRRWHAGRVGGVFAAMVLVLLVLFSVGAVMAGQVSQLVENLPRYEQTISSKIHALQRAARGPGVFGRLSHMYGDLRQQVSKSQTPVQGPAALRSTRTAPAGTPAKPVTVQVQSPTEQPLETIRAVGAPLFAPLARTGVVLVFVVFMLLFREDLRDRFVRLAGAQDLGRTSAAMDDAGRRLSRYFLTQTIVNASFGVLIGVGLWLIGVPNPLLWGVLAGLVRFVPYVGAFIAAAGPAALAIAVSPGWSLLFWTLGLFAVIELGLGQMVEPVLYGHHTGLSPVAVIVAATFWTWLWGPIGLLISTPLTVCVMVLGRHIERLEFLHVILGDEPALTPEQSFFQRMLAGDAHEAADQAEKFIKENSLCRYYDEIAVPGLLLARLDVQRGALDSARLKRMKETVEELVDDLADHEDLPPLESRGASGDSQGAEVATEAEPSRPEHELRPEWRGGKPVLCVGARDALDEAAVSMLAQLLQKHGIGVRIEAPAAVNASNVLRLDPATMTMICVASLGNASPVHRRYLIRRLRRRLPLARLLVVDLLEPHVTEPESDSAEVIDPDHRAGSLWQAVELCVRAAKVVAVAGAEQGTVAANQPSAV